MKTLRYLVAIGSLALLSAAEPKKDETAEDTKQIQGTWEVVSREMGGGETPGKFLKGQTWVFEKNKLMLKANDKVGLEMTFTLDASKDPKWIDTDDEGHPTLGIYKMVSKDALTICWGPLDGKERPTDFNTKDKQGFITHRFRRVKE